MKFKEKILKLFLVIAMIVGVTFITLTTMSATSNVEDAPVDWAFEASSMELNDAIVEAYPSVDTDGDGFINIAEANAMTGVLTLFNKGINGTLNGIENFTSLTALNLQQNIFTGSIPENIGNLTNLRALSLEWNKLTGEIPASIGDLTELTDLTLSSNQLSGDVPESISNLVNLRYLNLRGNGNITSIPASISNLKQLISLDVGLNKLTSLPEEITELESLEYLYADSNREITTIPENIGNLTNLRSLWMGDNKISDIPDSILDLGPFVYFHFGGNNITSITEEKYEILSHHFASNLSRQTNTEILTEKGKTNHDYEFEGLPAYEQFPNYGLTFTYSLVAPDGSSAIITPTIVDGIVTIPAEELSQAGTYTLLATGAGSLLDESVFTTVFSVEKAIDYHSAETNGSENTETTDKIMLTFSEDVANITIDDINLSLATRAEPNISKNELVSLGNGSYELHINGTWDEGTVLNVAIIKDSFVFSPNTQNVILHQKADTILPEETDKPTSNGKNINNVVENDTTSDSPITGDNTMLTGFGVALIGSLIILIAGIKLRKSRR